jgi:hypothetical protein
MKVLLRAVLLVGLVILMLGASRGVAEGEAGTALVRGVLPHLSSCLSCR